MVRRSSEGNENGDERREDELIYNGWVMNNSMHHCG